MDYEQALYLPPQRYSQKHTKINVSIDTDCRMSVQRTFLAAACGGSALAIVAALCMTVSILTDINSFYDVVITDMGEFKVRSIQPDF